jgi:hypothetical protein
MDEVKRKGQPTALTTEENHDEIGDQCRHQWVECIPLKAQKCLTKSQYKGEKVLEGGIGRKGAVDEGGGISQQQTRHEPKLLTAKPHHTRYRIQELKHDAHRRPPTLRVLFI